MLTCCISPPILHTKNARRHISILAAHGTTSHHIAMFLCHAPSEMSDKLQQNRTTLEQAQTQETKVQPQGNETSRNPGHWIPTT